MHELSLCNALLVQVERIATDHDAARVTRIVLTVGPLSGVEADLLKHAYPLAAAGTVAEHAELVTEIADIVVSCSQCGKETHARPNRLLCSACGDFQTTVISGDELILKRVELEQAQPSA